MRVSRERGRQTEIKRLPAILAAILNPSPNSPKRTTCLDMGKTNPALGPRETGKEGGSLVHSGTGGTSAKRPKLRRRGGEHKEGTVIRRWARIRLEANLDEKCTDWDV